MADWQTMETAPKDGTRIIAYCSKDNHGRQRMAVTWWRRQEDGHGYIGWGEFNVEYWPPTHWMPLPEPPK